MKRKHNPLVSLAALVLLFTILVLTCTGCAAESETTTAAAATNTTSRLKTEHAGYISTGGIMTIITDTETGVQYLLVTADDVALTVLQPGEG